MPNLWAWAASMAAAASTSVLLLAALMYWQTRSANERSTGEPTLVGAAVGVLAAAAGAVVGQAVIGLWPRWPPLGTLDRFLAIGLPIAVLLHAMPPQPGRWPWLRRTAALLAALGLVRLLLHGSVHLRGDATRPLLLIGGSAAMLLLVRGSLLRLADRTASPTILLAVAAALGSSGLMVAMAGYLKGGSAALPWSAALAGVALVLWLSPTRIDRQVDFRSVTGLAATALFGILFIGRFFGGLSTGEAVAAFGAPLAGWTSELPAIRCWPPRRRTALRLAVVAAVLLAILFAAKRRFDREMGPLLSTQSGPASGEARTNQSRAAVGSVLRECRWRDAQVRDFMIVPLAPSGGSVLTAHAGKRTKRQRAARR